MEIIYRFPWIIFLVTLAIGSFYFLLKHLKIRRQQDIALNDIDNRRRLFEQQIAGIPRSELRQTESGRKLITLIEKEKAKKKINSSQTILNNIMLRRYTSAFVLLSIALLIGVRLLAENDRSHLSEISTLQQQLADQEATIAQMRQEQAIVSWELKQSQEELARIKQELSIVTADDEPRIWVTGSKGIEKIFSVALILTISSLLLSIGFYIANRKDEKSQ